MASRAMVGDASPVALRERAHGLRLARARRGGDGVPAQERVLRVRLEEAPRKPRLEARERVQRGDLEEGVARRQGGRERACVASVARLLARERRVAEGLGRGDADVRVLVGERAHERRGAARVGDAAEHLDRELARVGVELVQRLDRRAHGVRADGDERLDRGVAKPDVHRVLAARRRARRRPPRGARAPAPRPRPPCARASRRRRGRAAAARRPSRPRTLAICWTATRRASGSACCSSQRTAAAASLTSATPGAGRAARGAGPISPGRRERLGERREAAPVSSTKTRPPRASSRPRCRADRRRRRAAGAGRSSAPPVPKTSVTASTTSATSRPDTSTTIHFVRRVAAGAGSARSARAGRRRARPRRGSRRRPTTARGACGSATTASGLAISFTRAICTAYSTSPTTKPTRFFEGSWRWRWCIARFLLPSGRLEDGAEVEQDEDGAARRPPGARCPRCAPAARRRGRSGGSISSAASRHTCCTSSTRSPICSPRAGVGEQDARPAVDGRLRRGGSGGAGR